MNKIFIPTKSPKDWKQFLAEPKKHWKDGCSAKSLAYSWEKADDDLPGKDRCRKAVGKFTESRLNMGAAILFYEF